MENIKDESLKKLGLGKICKSFAVSILKIEDAKMNYVAIVNFFAPIRTTWMVIQKKGKSPFLLKSVINKPNKQLLKVN